MVQVPWRHRRVHRKAPCPPEAQASPRLDKNIHVLLTLDPAQYPLGIKGLITEKDPDVPVVWTNMNFKMLYVVMMKFSGDFPNNLMSL